MNDRERFEQSVHKEWGLTNFTRNDSGGYTNMHVALAWWGWQEARRCTPINIVFDGPPGPQSGRFVEVETDDGKSIRINGEWIKRADGLFALRIISLPEPPDEQEAG